MILKRRTKRRLLAVALVLAAMFVITIASTEARGELISWTVRCNKWWCF